MKAVTTLAAVAAMFPEILTLIPETKPKPLFTHADEVQIKQAEDKRARKAALRLARSKKE